MTRALSKSRTVPRRGLSRQEAAEYLGVSIDDFDTHVAQARVAKPRVAGDQLVWDIHELRISRSGSAFDAAEVYVVGFDSYVKIGVSKDAARRIAELQAGLPAELTIYKIFGYSNRNDEQRYHSQFAEYRTRGEWYLLEGALAAWVDRIRGQP